MNTVYPLNQVEGSVRAVLEASGGHADLWRMQENVRNALNPSREQTARDRLDGQVKRILDAMAGSGDLIKIKRGDYLPGGSSTDRPHYYTPERYQQEKEKAARRKAEFDARTARWERIAARLRSRGFKVITHHPQRWPLDSPKNGTTGVEIALEAWEEILRELS